MKQALYAAVATLSLVAIPAFAGEGNGEPFPFAVPALSASGFTAGQPRDVAATAYPDMAGLPGSDLPRLAGDVLPPTGSAGAVQTANSLPAGFADGTAAYAQAQSAQRWFAAHDAVVPAYAQAARGVRPRG